MEHSKLEKLRLKTDGQLFLNAALLPGIILAVCWIFWLSSQFFNVDLMGLIKRRDKPISTNFYLSMAGIATVICSIWSWLNFSKQRQLVRHGIMIEAVLTKIGIAASGMRNCSYTYDYNGKSYTQHVSLLEVTAQEIGVGGHLPVIIDPSRPSKSLPLSEL